MVTADLFEPAHLTVPPNPYHPETPEERMQRVLEEQALYAFSFIDNPTALCPEDAMACQIALEVFKKAAPERSKQPIITTPLPIQRPPSKPSLLTAEKSVFRLTTERSENDSDDESEREFIDKPGRIYKCPRPNCFKAYKNRNGLKYHLVKGQCKRLYGYVQPEKSEYDEDVSLN